MLNQGIQFFLTVNSSALSFKFVIYIRNINCNGWILICLIWKWEMSMQSAKWVIHYFYSEVAMSSDLHAKVCLYNWSFVELFEAFN